ncbi:MAG: ArsR family transcriptional regulator [Candidatus Acidiferrales bacterium]
MVAKLCGGQPHSISQLTEGLKLTRQAVTKHLRVLESRNRAQRPQRSRVLI